MIAIATKSVGLRKLIFQLRLIFGGRDAIVPAAKPRVEKYLFSSPLLVEPKDAVLSPGDNLIGDFLSKLLVQSVPK
jgi:hypothetical protein